MRTIPIGLLGYGLAGSTFHAPLIRTIPSFAIAAVMTSRRDDVARDLPAARVVDAAEAIFGDPAIELVVVATPNASHFELARQALLAGKHVVIDKPMTTSSADADTLIELARRRGRLLTVYQNRRWDNDFLTVRKIIDEGRLGTVFAYEAHFDRFRPAIKAGWHEVPHPGAGVLFDLGSHLIDQALVLFGMPETVTADVFAQRADALVDDYFHIVLGYGERRAIVHASALVREPGPHFVVHGDAGSFIKYGMDPQEEALKAGRPADAPDWGREDPAASGTLVTAGGERETVVSVPGAYADFYAQLAAAISDGAPVPVSAPSARDVIAVIELARQSAVERCTIVA